MSDSGCSVVWLRQDLRLADNPALLAAVERGDAVIPIFVWSPGEEGRWPMGAAARWWLHQSLASLDSSLRERGSRLVIRSGPALDVIREFVDQTGATAVVWNRRYEPAAVRRDSAVKTALVAAGLHVKSHNGSLLHEPWEVETQQSRPYQVFSAFWRACLARPAPDPPCDAPQSIAAPRRWPASLRLSELDLEPKIDWAGGFRTGWEPGEAGAKKRLEQFIDESLSDYAAARNYPGAPGSSRLSPHLHFGEISPRRVWWALHVGRGGARLVEAKRVFASELGWREFAYHLLFHFPRTPEHPLKEEFSAFPWNRDQRKLRAWRRGRTGYPIVDAAMRELWRTGWMHNRARMIVASFLVKDLLLPWRVGAEWFWDTLVDANLANNTLGWQWTAGCGADAAPYFRVFNPVAQGEKFDANGVYVRQWVPELRELPDEWIHEPWNAPPLVLAEAGVELGVNYPRPIVDHKEARKSALEAFEKIKR